MADRRGINGNSASHLGNPRGCITSLLYLNSTVSTGTSTTDYIQTDFDSKVRVLRAWIVGTESGLGDLERIALQDKDGNAITDTLDYAGVVAGDAVEFSFYNTTNRVLAKSESIKVVKTATTAVTSCEVYVEVAKEA